MLRFLAFLAVFLQHAFQKTPAQYFPATHPNWIGRAVQILQAHLLRTGELLASYLTQHLARSPAASGKRKPVRPPRA